MTLSDLNSILVCIPENPGQSILFGLAVIGGGVIGGFLTGFAAQASVKLSTGQTTPRWSVNAMRAFGGLASAVILAVLLFSEAGGRGPGSGGKGSGDGLGNGQVVSTQPNSSPTQPKKDDKPPQDPPKTAKPMRVVVVKPSSEAVGQWYQIEGADDMKRYTLSGIQKEILDRKKAEPPITAVVLVLTHADSPGKRTGPVEDLADWVKKDANLDSSLELPDK